MIEFILTALVVMLGIVMAVISWIFELVVMVIMLPVLFVTAIGDLFKGKR